MRIREWSSDVCSSDLSPIVLNALALIACGAILHSPPRRRPGSSIEPAVTGPRPSPGKWRRTPGGGFLQAPHERFECRGRSATAEGGWPMTTNRERESVVGGKQVYGHVNQGWRSKLKKK